MTDFAGEDKERRSRIDTDAEQQIRRRDIETDTIAEPRGVGPGEPATEIDEHFGNRSTETQWDDDASTRTLFPAEESDRFRSRWMEIQTHFVDEPRRSVEEADALVKEVTDRLVSVFTRSRDELDRQWTAGDDVSTEDLRLTLQRYRSFFERLLSV